MINFHDMFPPDPNKETVTEEMHPEKEWFDEARKIDEEGLPGFYERIIHGYNHDYGTVCHAVAAVALAAAWAACKENDTGLSSFQAGFVMWDFIRYWTKQGNECGLKLVDYDDMLYPQYEDKFEKTIKKDVWESIQNKAKENLKRFPDAHPMVLAHWKNIVNGEIPFGYTVTDDI